MKDVIIIDYDHLKFPRKLYAEEKKLYEELKKLASQYNIAFRTSSQKQPQSEDMENNDENPNREAVIEIFFRCRHDLDVTGNEVIRELTELVDEAYAQGLADGYNGGDVGK